MFFANPLASITMWLIFGAASAYMAKIRGKNPFLWFFLGMFFGIFGLAFLFFSPKVQAPEGVKPKATEEEGVTTIDVTPKLDPIHENKFWYYLDPQNQQHGPMSFQGLIQSWREGKITELTNVWNENLEGWQPLKNFLNI